MYPPDAVVLHVCTHSNPPQPARHLPWGASYLHAELGDLGTYQRPEGLAGHFYRLAQPVFVSRLPVYNLSLL